MTALSLLRVVAATLMCMLGIVTARAAEFSKTTDIAVGYKISKNGYYSDLILRYGNGPALRIRNGGYCAVDVRSVDGIRYFIAATPACSQAFQPRLMLVQRGPGDGLTLTDAVIGDGEFVAGIDTSVQGKPTVWLRYVDQLGTAQEPLELRVSIQKGHFNFLRDQPPPSGKARFELARVLYSNWAIFDFSPDAIRVHGCNRGPNLVVRALIASVPRLTLCGVSEVYSNELRILKLSPDQRIANVTTSQESISAIVDKDRYPQPPQVIFWGTRAGEETTITSKRGIGTSQAIIRTRRTDQNFNEDCDPGVNIDGTPNCKGGGTLGEKAQLMRANCRKGEFINFDGRIEIFSRASGYGDFEEATDNNLVRHKGKGAANIVLRDESSSDFVNFKHLCPMWRSVK